MNSVSTPEEDTSVTPSPVLTTIFGTHNTKSEFGSMLSVISYYGMFILRPLP